MRFKLEDAGGCLGGFVNLESGLGVFSCGFMHRIKRRLERSIGYQCLE
jgi:hypothetical protein